MLRKNAFLKASFPTYLLGSWIVTTLWCTQLANDKPDDINLPDEFICLYVPEHPWEIKVDGPVSKHVSSLSPGSSVLWLSGWRLGLFGWYSFAHAGLVALMSECASIHSATHHFREPSCKAMLRQYGSTWQEKAVDWMALVGSRIDGCYFFMLRCMVGFNICTNQKIRGQYDMRASYDLRA